MWNLIIILLAVINLSCSIFIISSYKMTLKKYLLFLILIMPISIIAFSLSEFLSTAIVFFAITTCNYINTHRRGQSFIASSLCVLNAFIADGILSNIGVGILKIDMNVFLQSKINTFIYFIICICMQLIICYSIKKLIESKFQLLNLNLPKVQYGLIVLLLVSSVGVIIYNANMGKLNGLSNEVLWITNIVLLSYGIVIMGIILFLIRSGQLEQKRKLDLQELKHKKLELNQLKIYTTELERMYEEIRGVRHDFSNILTGMCTMITEKKYEQLDNYYCNTLMPLTTQLKQNYYKLGNLHNMKIPEVKGLLAMKLIEAYQKDIDFVVELSEPIEEPPTEIIKLCRIIGIIIDNAMEESECCEDSFVKCAFIKKESEITFAVCNKCRKLGYSMNKLVENGFSTKGENRGFGLYNLHKMEKEDPYITILTEIREDMFETTVSFLYN